MRIDLRNSLNEGMTNMLTWRNRYSKSEYPEKVAINIFYRKYTMEFMFPEILGCFETNFLGRPKSKWSDFNEGFQGLKTTYGNTAVSKTQPVLLNLLSNSQRTVGNTNYGMFTNLITESKNGSKSKLEELEYAYMFYLLTDESVLLWGALGGTGLSKIDAIGEMSGLIIEVDEIKTYGQIDQVLGQLCAAPYLKDNYKSLPPNV
jgi:hypothetical protein